MRIKDLKEIEKRIVCFKITMILIIIESYYLNLLEWLTYFLELDQIDNKLKILSKNKKRN